MKKVYGQIAIIGFILMMFGCNNVQEKEKPRDPKYQAFYDVINEVDTLRFGRPLIISSGGLYLGTDSKGEYKWERWVYDTLLGIGDSAFFKEQMKAAKDFVWKQEMLPDARVINSDSLFNPKGIIDKNYMKRIEDLQAGWEKFHAMYGKKTELIMYSVPIFSKDSSRCLIIYEAAAGWSMDSRGGTNYYKKVNGKWKFIKEYRGWVS